MSITQSQSHVSRLADPSDSAFVEHVYENTEICSNCFRRIKRTETLSVEHGSVGSRERGYSERTEDGVMGQGDVGNRVYRPRTFCRACGSQSGRDVPETLSKHEAIDRARALADRLAEERHPVNVDVLRRTVWMLKSDPDLRGCDTEIFERATKLAIEHAQP